MKFNVLDEGYVESIEAWGRGSDKRHRPETRREVVISEQQSEWCSEPDFEIGIIEAARQSTQGNFRGWDEDGKLLKTLFMSHPQHATPFEFAGLVIEVQAPIFVFREWHRHRTQSYNEMSARYAKLPNLCYEPNLAVTLERCERARHTKNKQQQSLELKTEVIPAEVENWLKGSYQLQEMVKDHYIDGLAIGIPKELARLNMPVAHYSRMRASTNLRNWIGFMTLRDEEGVQWETREFATALKEILEQTFPNTMKLFEQKRSDYREYLEWRRAQNRD